MTNTLKKLIKCSACESEIACTAKMCPKCGAENRWIHPEVKRFLDTKKENFPLACRYEYDKQEIVFFINDPKWWQFHYHMKKIFITMLVTGLLQFIKLHKLVGDVGFFLRMIFSAIAGLAFLLLLVAVVTQILDSSASPSRKYLGIDFSEDPPLVKTNDQALFVNVLKWFNLDRVKSA